MPYTQNRKLGNLGKFYFTPNFDSSRNSRLKTGKKTETKTKWLRYGFRKYKEHFRDLRVFDFALYPKSKIWKSRKLLFYFKF